MDWFLENNNVASGQAFLNNNVIVSDVCATMNIEKSTFVTGILKVGDNILENDLNMGENNGIILNKEFGMTSIDECLICKGKNEVKYGFIWSCKGEHREMCIECIFQSSFNFEASKALDKYKLSNL
jgi:hypothetical protein